MNLPIKLKIPESFYQEEEKCGHLITSKEKKIWAVELDLLNEFKRVCEKYNLRWYVAYGTLLGTVRHKGFIPWDNDVDVWMPRKDFRELCKHSDEFEHPYFLQTPVTEKGRYFSSYGKLCNSLTTGSARYYTDQGINGGLYIDIFILDNVPVASNAYNLIKKKIKYYYNFEQCFHKKRKFSFSMNYVKHIARHIMWNTFCHNWDGAVLFEKIDDICSKDIIGDTLIGCYASPYGDKDIHSKNAWREMVWKDFEMIQVPIPSGYDEVLTNLYKNYMQFPPIEQRTTHSYLDFEPEIPYKEYYNIE